MTITSPPNKMLNKTLMDRILCKRDLWISEKKITVLKKEWTGSNGRFRCQSKRVLINVSKQKKKLYEIQHKTSFYISCKLR